MSTNPKEQIPAKFIGGPWDGETRMVSRERIYLHTPYSYHVVPCKSGLKARYQLRGMEEDTAIYIYESIFA